MFFYVKPSLQTHIRQLNENGKVIDMQATKLICYINIFIISEAESMVTK